MTFQSQLWIRADLCRPRRPGDESRLMIDHRGPEFGAILSEITAGAKRVFKTKTTCSC
jgi:hypothetical protein